MDYLFSLDKSAKVFVEKAGLFFWLQAIF